MMSAVFAAQLALLADGLWGLRSGEQGASESVTILLISLAIFVPLMRWQRDALARVDEVMGGSATQLLEARKRLIDAALCDIESRWARLVVLITSLVAATMLGAAALGKFPWWLALATAGALGFTYGWSYTVRLPRLRRERAVVVAMQQELAD